MTAHALSLTETKGRQDGFKPVPVRAPEGRYGRLALRFRCFFDLQLATILPPLSQTLPQLSGSVLDVGCGERPYRHLLSPDASYTGIDVPESSDFGMARNPEIVLFDGATIPFAAETYDAILCTEVLEHCPEPAQLIAEMERVLRPGGTLVMTVPFAARIHHSPHDYTRFTPYALERMLGAFTGVSIVPRGNEVATIANKLLVLTLSLAGSSRRPVLDKLAAALVAPMAAVFTLAAHVSLRGARRPTDDPLGYFIIARKP